MIIYSIVICSLFWVTTSCCTSPIAKEHIVCEWKNKEIILPSNSIFTIKGKDSINYTTPASNYKIISYVDSLGCLSCKLEFARWEGFMQEIYAGEKDVDVSLILYICPKNRVEVENLLFFNSFIYPICIDEQDDFNKLNQIPKGEQYHTFLLNKNNRIVCIGNPIYNLAIKELYLQNIK